MSTQCNLDIQSDRYSSTRHHPELWFPDGSVVLVAQETSFCVHISILSRQSVFFRDMFSLPQPPSTAGTANDCPIIDLHDSDQDLENLLFALYDGPKFGDNSKDDFRVVSGILRLAHKFMIDSLRSRALAHLATAWPSTLKAWDARVDVAGDFYGERAQNRFYPSPVDVINLAREVAAPSLLPSAFYDLSRYTFTQMLGCSRPERTSSLSLQLLSLPDTHKLMLGKESAHQAVSSLIRSLATDTIPYSHSHSPTHSVFTPGSPTSRPTHALHKRSRTGACTSIAACRRDIAELVQLATQHYLFDRERGAYDPLYVAEELGMLKSNPASSSSESQIAQISREDRDGEGVECRACTRALEAWAARERERLWRLIPVWFRLDA